MKKTLQLYSMGFDVGTSRLKCCLLENRDIIGSFSMPSGKNIKKRMKEGKQSLLRKANLKNRNLQYRGVTGFGAAYTGKNIRKIALHDCLAAGAIMQHPEIRTIVDFGSYFITVVKLNDSGIVSEYIQNEKCAVGSSRFLDIVLQRCGLEWDNLPDFVLPRDHPYTQTCAIFAESEMISMLNSNVPPIDVVAGILLSIVRKAQTMMYRIRAQPPIFLTGGLLLNGKIRRNLETAFEGDTFCSSIPEGTAAFGAAILSRGEVIETIGS